MMMVDVSDIPDVEVGTSSPSTAGMRRSHPLRQAAEIAGTIRPEDHHQIIIAASPGLPAGRQRWSKVDDYLLGGRF